MELRRAFAYLALMLAAIAMAGGLQLLINTGPGLYPVGLLAIGLVPLLVLQRPYKVPL